MRRVRATVYLTTTNPKQIQVLHKFAKGIDLAGDISTPVWEDRIVESDCAVILWSPKLVEGAPETNFRVQVFEHYRSQGKPVVIIEQPIIRSKRFHKFFQYRVGLNDVTRLGCFGNKNKLDDRWRKLNIDLVPWRTTGTNYVVCGQYPYDYSLGGIDLNKWVEKTVKTIQKNTTAKVQFKPHPLVVSGNLPMPNVDVEVINIIDWETTRATVTYSSGMSIDSLMNGVPCITVSERNFAWEHSTHDIRRPHHLVCPDNRYQLFCDLAYAQWNIVELENGACWSNLRQCVIDELERVSHITP